MDGNKVFRGMAHIGIFTDNFDKTLEFYTEILPFEIVKNTIEEHPGDDSGVYPLKVCIARLNDIYLELIETNNKGWTANGVDGAFNHLGISVYDLDVAIAYIKEAGFPEERIADIVYNSEMIPGKIYRSCRIRGYNDENIGLYEVDNATFYTE